MECQIRDISEPGPEGTLTCQGALVSRDLSRSISDPGLKGTFTCQGTLASKGQWYICVPGHLRAHMMRACEELSLISGLGNRRKARI